MNVVTVAVERLAHVTCWAVMGLSLVTVACLIYRAVA